MGELDGITVFKIGEDPYTREDLMNMEPVCLRALLRERVHHTIEVEIYPIVLGRKRTACQVWPAGRINYGCLDEAADSVPKMRISSGARSTLP